MANRWYVALDGEELGPLSDTGLERLIQGGRVDGTTMVRNGTSGEWLTVELAEEMLAVRPRGSAPAKRPFKPLKRRDWPRERRKKTGGRAAEGTARSRGKLRPRRPRRVLPTTPLVPPPLPSAQAVSENASDASDASPPASAADVAPARPFAARLGRPIGRRRRDPGRFVIDRLDGFRSVFIFHVVDAADQSISERQSGACRLAAAGRATPARSGSRQGQTGGACQSPPSDSPPGPDAAPMPAGAPPAPDAATTVEASSKQEPAPPEAKPDKEDAPRHLQRKK